MIRRSGILKFQGDLMMFRSRVLAVLTAAVMTVSATAAFAQKKDEKKKHSKQEQAEIEQLVKLVDGVMAGQPAPTDITLAITPFFLKSQEARTFVPFVLSATGAPASDGAMPAHRQPACSQMPSAPAPTAPAGDGPA